MPKSSSEKESPRARTSETTSKRKGAPGSGGKGRFQQWNNKNNVWTWVLFGVAILLLVSVYTKPDLASQKISLSDFREKVSAGEIVRVVFSGRVLKGYSFKENAAPPKSRNGGKVFVALAAEDPTFLDFLRANDAEYDVEDTTLPDAFWNWIFPIIVVLLILRLMFGRMFKMGPGAGLMSFGKNRARLVEDDSKKVTFDDVAGVEEAKDELKEIIEFLRTPEKFRAIGGKIPKGILLVGPPGTGKTLLARAVAGEANVPFFSLSGSEFVEMFVGVGAARVRDLFAQAVEKSPCIVFVDELDAIGKVRSAVSPLGGHDEREQTLNQLLVEMDGFDAKAGVIIMAATNRPETLDPALLRAGRFDRQVLVDRPDIKGREAILKIHADKVKLAPQTDLHVVAARTPGFVGADLANVVNEAALLAVRKGKQIVELADFDDAVDRVVAGLQKKSRLINKKEKRIVAHHETGHALVTHFNKDTDPVHKISVIPRGFGALGFTLALPTEDRYLMTEGEILGRIDVLFGGRVAEEVIFGEVSTGAQDDIQKATDLAKRMVMEFGMGKRIGRRAYMADRSSFISSPMGPLTHQKEYSEAAAEKIDEEIDSILKESYERVRKLIISKRPLLEYIANILSEKEVMEGKDFERLVEEFENRTHEGAGVEGSPVPCDLAKSDLRPGETTVPS